MVDEPEGRARTHGEGTGGWVAAPIVRRVVERIGPILGVEHVRDGAHEDGGEELLVRAKARAPKVATN